MQRTLVPPLVQEDPTYLGATKPHEPQLLKRRCLEPVLCTREATAVRSLCPTTEERPLTAGRKSLHNATKTQHSHR